MDVSLPPVDFSLPPLPPSIPKDNHQTASPAATLISSGIFSAAKKKFSGVSNFAFPSEKLPSLTPEKSKLQTVPVGTTEKRQRRLAFQEPRARTPDVKDAFNIMGLGDLKLEQDVPRPRNERLRSMNSRNFLDNPRTTRLQQSLSSNTASSKSSELERPISSASSNTTREAISDSGSPIPPSGRIILPPVQKKKE